METGSGPTRGEFVEQLSEVQELETETGSGPTGRRVFVFGGVRALESDLLGSVVAPTSARRLIVELFDRQETIASCGAFIVGVLMAALGVMTAAYLNLLSNELSAVLVAGGAIGAIALAASTVWEAITIPTTDEIATSERLRVSS